MSSPNPFNEKIKDAYLESAEFFAGVVDRIGEDDWERPALGQWTLRDLAGHTYRSITTIIGYSEKPAAEAAMDSAVAWVLTALERANPEAVAEMGRSAGLEIIDNPPMFVRGFLNMARGRLSELPDATLMASPWGGIPLVDYLQVRTMELVVHTLDLAQAAGVEAEPPPGGLQVALQVLAGVAVARGQGPALALAATGRAPLPEGFNILF